MVSNCLPFAGLCHGHHKRGIEMGRAEFRVEEDAGPGPDGLGTVPGNYYIVHTHTHYWLGLLVAPRVSLLTATPINLSSLEANPYHDECELA